MNVEIIAAKPENVNEILGLIKELAHFEKAPDEVVLTENQLMEDLFGDKKIAEALVALVDNRIAGTAVYYTKYSTWKGKCLYLEDIIVSDGFRGCGIGKKLFSAVMRIAHEREMGRMEWQVLDWDEPAIRFYKHFGATLDPEWINGKFTNVQLKNYFEHA
ncbi:MAG: GNAT family N-acetyltransferase [Bacteroidia bacterium]